MSMKGQTRFGQLLKSKRVESGLSIDKLAHLSGVPAERIEEMERGKADQVSFDTCYHLSRALTSQGGKMFTLLDLWLALKADRMDTEPNNGNDGTEKKSAA